MSYCPVLLLFKILWIHNYKEHCNVYGKLTLLLANMDIYSHIIQVYKSPKCSIHFDIVYHQPYKLSIFYVAFAPWTCKIHHFLGKALGNVLPHSIALS